MCAILGAINYHDEKNFKKALNIISHRGIDYQSIIKTPFGMFGFNRLAIENLNINNQPLFKDNIVVLFNGEIFNYKYLIKKYQLNAKTEVEVIFELWKKFNTKFVTLLDGMFAIAIYDKKIYLFRDIFGKKPLYFTKDGIFASEIKAILEFKNKNLNIKALNEYLAYGTSIAPNTIFEGIYKLPAGYFYDGELKQYFDFQKKELFKYDESQNKIEELLRNSILKRLNHSEVEVGSLLSGGVDSSLIAAIVSKHQKLQTFTIGYEDYKSYDEREYARIVSKHINSYHNEVVLSKKEFFDNLYTTLFFMDEPIADSSFFAANFLAKHIPLKVVLSGEGSDELFLGYRKYQEYYQFLTASLPNKSWLNKYLLRHYEDIKEWEIFRRFFANEEIFRGINEIFFQTQINKTLKKRAQKVEFERFIKEWREFKFTYFDLKIWIGEVLLMKLDKMFMAYSIEARSPFLDKELVEYIFSLDKIKINKEIIKNIAIKYLPKEIVFRRKKGFALPFYEWLKEKNEFRRIIDINRKSKLFNEEYLKEILKTGHKRYKQHIWSLYLFSIWYEKEFLD